MFKKRVLSIFLVVLFLTTSFPITALADVTFGSGSGSMSTPRGYYPGAAVIDSNRILVFGGSNPNYSTRLSSAEIYNISSKTFSSAGSMSTARNNNALNTVTLSNGNVFVCGGYNGSTLSNISLYNPSSNSWTNSSKSLLTSRCWHTVTELQDGRILIAGGKSNGTYLKSVEIYNPSTNTISYAASMNYFHSAGAATLLKDGRVLVAGGDTNGDPRDTKSEIYDPETNTWTTISNYPEPGRAGAILVTMDSGIVMLMGGNSGADGSNGADTTTYYYYPERSGSSAWEPGPSMSGVAKSRAAYAKVGDTVYIIGGGSNDSSFEATVTTATINEPKLASINGLEVSPGSLNPSYNQETIEYDAGEPANSYKYSGNQSFIDVTATSTNGSIYINNLYASSGSPARLSLNKGENTIYVDVKDNDNIVRRYTINAYRKYESTVTYNANGGTGTLPVDNNKYEPDNNAVVKSEGDLERDGYRFKCWGTSPTGGTLYYPNNSLRMGENSITLYAQWTKTYDVTYYGNNSDDDTDTPVDDNTPYDTGAQVTVKNEGNLEKEGYTFDGWNTVAGGTGTAYTVGKGFNISADMDFYAQWDLNSYTVTFDSREGSAVNSQDIDHGEKVVEPADPNRPGYTFGGWYTAVSFADDEKWDFDNDTITEARTLYAKWTPSDGTIYTNKYFHQDTTGDGYSEGEVVEESGTTEAEVTIPEKDFEGFTENTTHVNRNITDNIAGDGSTVLARYYDRTEHTVTFDDNMEEEDAANMPAQQTIRYDGKVTEPQTDPTFTNYTFGGWYKESECNNAWDFDNDTVTEDTVLYARWVINMRQITYVDNDGANADVVDEQEAGSTFDLHSGDGFVREGWIIDGWTIEGTLYQLGALYTIPDADVEAAAEWIEDTDGDGISDEDELAAGTDPENPNDEPDTGTVKLELLLNDGTPAVGIDCVLNSQPVTATTDGNGNAIFNDISLSRHTLSLREGGAQVGTFNLEFTRGPSNTVTTDAATGTILTTVTGNFLTLNVTIQQNGAGSMGAEQCVSYGRSTRGLQRNNGKPSDW